MKGEWMAIIALSVAFLGLFALAEAMYVRARWKAEWTRKMVHVGTGLLTLFFPVVLQNQWSVLLLCGSFALLLIGSLYYRWLPSINAIDRFSVGSLMYPVAVYGCYLLFEAHHRDYTFFYVPVLILAVSDPAAALSGRAWPKGRYSVGKETKTLMGSSVFFVTALLLFTLISRLSGKDLSLLLLWRGVVVAAFCTIAEAVSGKGTDNLTIPAAAVAALEVTLLP